MKKRILTIVLVAAFILANAGLDQVSKKIAEASLAGMGTVQVVGDVFIMTLVKNNGGFLGFGSEWPDLLKLVILQLAPLVILAAMLIILFASSKLILSERLALAAVLGGGASNIMERLVTGEVIDFMNFGIGPLRTGILNVADLSVFFGVTALMVIMMLKNRKLKKSSAEAKPDASASRFE